jgi:hypothetical protein
MRRYRAAAKGALVKNAILILMLIAACLPVFAAGKVTVDPNASGAAVAKPDQDMETDARLARRVTLSESRKCVSTILDDLTKATGVVFKAGYNNNDWQVRDRKMCVFAKDVPLVQIMNSISHVMKFKWSRTCQQVFRDLNAVEIPKHLLPGSTDSTWTAAHCSMPMRGSSERTNAFAPKRPRSAEPRLTITAT